MQIFDISINKIYLFISSTEFSTTWNVLGFIGVMLVFLTVQYFILKYASGIVKNFIGRSKSLLSKVYKITIGTQYTLAAILIIIALQMIFAHYYNTRLLILSISISYSFSLLMLGILVRQFSSWFRSNKSAVILLYTVAVIMIGTEAGTGGYLSSVLLVSQTNTEVAQPIVASYTAIIPDNLIPLNYCFIISSILSFAFSWVATAIVLRHHSKRLGRIRYWILVSSPLLFFLLQFQPFLLFVIAPYGMANPVSFAIIYTLLFSASKPVGGLLFAAAFWTIARKISNRNIKDYMLISAFGLALIFGSDQAIVLANKPYPPFGLPTVSLMGFASYLLLMGIYSSAISIGMDSALRQSIRAYALREAKLLDSIGIAAMRLEIEKRVIFLTKQTRDNMVKETGIQPDLAEEDMKKYLDDVLEELKDRRASA
jgi:hypothetical protein